MISRNSMFIVLLLTITGLLPVTLLAEDLLMIRTRIEFTEALKIMKASIKSHGYTVSHEQKCDGGLTGLGYKTDFYRVLFFGKPKEVRSLSVSNPELIPFLPLKLSIYAENNDTIVSTYNPKKFKSLFKNEKLDTQFDRWESDMRSILNEVLSVNPDELP